MNSSARNIFSSLQLRPTSFVKTLSILGIFIIVISYSYWSHLANIKGVFTHLKPTPAQTQPEKLADHGWTQNIWQTSKYPAENISSENEKYMKTWTDLNPGYQHKLLTDELIAGYVRDHFHASNPDIEETFLQAKDFVLQLDLIKYMVLWAEGGVYSDLDVACVRPISQWVPPQFIDKAGIVLGVQTEQTAGLDDSTKDTFQLAGWTIMSKPNQPFLWFLYQRLTDNTKHLADEQIVPAPNSRPYNISDVTGRNALTQGFLAYAASVTATKVTGNNFTKVTEPILFGEILVLPVQAFASPFQNGKEFVHHYGAGSWKSKPWDKLQPSVNEEQKKKEPEENEVAEEEKNVEAEKQKQEDVETTGDQISEDDKKVGVSEEKESSPAGNSTGSADVSTKGQTNVNGIAEPSKPPVEANKASPADGKKPTSDKPPSVQYENAEVKDKPTTNDKPPSVQYENVKVAENVTDTRHNTSNSASQHSTNDNTNTENAIDKDTATKAEDETEAKEEAEKLKAQAAAKKAAEAKKEEEEKKAAEAQKKKEEEGEQRLAEEEAKKAAAAKKKKEEEESLAEEQKKKTAEPKWAPLNEAGKLVSSNNLADYGAEFVPSD